MTQPAPEAAPTASTDPQPELSEDQLDDVSGGGIEITGFPDHLA
jgi:hypothetical protein